MLKPRSVLMAFLVGVGITMCAVIIPARRAAKIPPIAAMRPELGFAALSSKRLVAGTVTVIIGTVLFLVGLFARPGGTPGLILLAGGGALLMFLGTASVASTIAKPVTRMIGWPVSKVYGAPGQLARDNAGRAPKRTSATAAALMIGVALVSAASVFAASLRDTFVSAIDRGITADYVVQPKGFGTLTTDIATQLSALPELSAVSGVRFIQAEVATADSAADQKDFSVVDATAFPQLVDLGMIEGDEADLANGIFVNKDPAKDLGLHVGDTVTVTFKNGASEQLPVTGIYRDAALAGNWVIGTRDGRAGGAGRAGRLPRRDRASPTACPTSRRATAIDGVVSKFPQAELRTAEEYKKDSAAQIDQLLVIITVLLAFAIVIAVLGISITLGLAVFERTREIGLMRAVGMTKRQTRKMVRWEAVIVSIFGAILGIVLGTLIGVALVAVGAQQRGRRDHVQLVDDRDHPRRRRARRASWRRSTRAARRAG